MARVRNVQQLAYEDGSVYFGQLEDGVRHGSGYLSIADGSVYIGEWNSDNYNGEGIYIYPDG